MKKKILLLSLLLFSLFGQSMRTHAGDEENITFIESMGGVLKVPISVLQNKERGEGSTIYKSYNKPPLLLPTSREEASYFPIAHKSLKAIVSFLKDGTLAYEECSAERLCQDVKECQLDKMSTQLAGNIKEKELFEDYPKLKHLSKNSPDNYKRVLLAVAA
ncbi:MAG: hypothetical protein HQK50_14045, partial [Oligoflexia bacterium]|nr:hypothetical protein [Oligoflexia bacterium]